VGNDALAVLLPAENVTSAEQRTLWATTPHHC